MQNAIQAGTGEGGGEAILEVGNILIFGMQELHFVERAFASTHAYTSVLGLLLADGEEMRLM